MASIFATRHTSASIPAARPASFHASFSDASILRLTSLPAGVSGLTPRRTGTSHPTHVQPGSSHTHVVLHAFSAVLPESRAAQLVTKDSDTDLARLLALNHFKSILESQEKEEAPNKLLGWSFDKVALSQLARQVWPAPAVPDDVKVGKMLLALVLLSSAGGALTAGRAGIRTLGMSRMLGLRDFRMAELVSGDDMFIYSGSFDNANTDDQLSINLACARLQLALSLRPEAAPTPSRPMIQADSETLELAQELQEKLQAHRQAIQEKRGEQLRASLDESAAASSGLEYDSELERMRKELSAIMKAMLMSSWHVGTAAERESPIGWVLDMDKARQESTKTWAQAQPERALLKLGVLLVLLHAPGGCMEVDAMAMAVSRLLDCHSWAPHRPMDVLEDDIGIFTIQMVPIGGSKSSMVVALDIPAYLSHRTKFISKDMSGVAAPPTPTTPSTTSNSGAAASAPAASAASAIKSSAATSVKAGSSEAGPSTQSGAVNGVVVPSRVAPVPLRQPEEDEFGVPVLSASAAEFAAELRSKGVRLDASSEMQQQTMMQAQVLGCLRTLLQDPEVTDSESPLDWSVSPPAASAFAELVWPNCSPPLRRIKLGLLLVLLNEAGCTSTTKYAGPASCEVMELDSWSPYRLRDIVGQDPIFCASPSEEEGHWSIHANLPAFLINTFKAGTIIPGLDGTHAKSDAATTLFAAATVAAEKAAQRKEVGPQQDGFTISAAAAAAAAVNVRQQLGRQAEATVSSLEAGSRNGGVSAGAGAAGAQGASGVPAVAEELVKASATWGDTRPQYGTIPYQSTPSPTTMAASLANGAPTSTVAPWVLNNPQANERYRASILPKLASMLKDPTRSSGDKWSFRMSVARVIGGWLWPECPLDVSLVKLALSVALLSEPSASASLTQAAPRVCQLLSNKKYTSSDLKVAVDNDPVFLLTPPQIKGDEFNVGVNISAFQEKVAAANAISEYQHHEEQQHNQRLQQIVALQARQRQQGLTNTTELAAQASTLRQKMLMAAMSRAGATMPISSGTVQDLTSRVAGSTDGGGRAGAGGTYGVSQAAGLLAQALIRASVNVAKKLLPTQPDKVGSKEDDARKWVSGKPVLGPAPAVRPPLKALAFQETHAESMLARVAASIDADLNASVSKGELGWTVRFMVTNLPGDMPPVVGFAVARGRRDAKQKAALRALTDLKGAGMDIYSILKESSLPAPQLTGETETVVGLPVAKNIQMGGRTVAIGLTDASFPEKYLPLQQHMVLAASIISSLGVAVDMGMLRRALIVPRCNVKSSRRLAWIGATQFGGAIKLWLDGASPVEDDDTDALQDVFESYTNATQCSNYLRDLGLERFVVTPAGHTASEEELQSVFYAVLGSIYWSNRSDDEVSKFLVNSGIIRV